ncbi:MAG TPA: di-heme oxidoredictase family protein [Terriglobia bacterium]
MKRQMLLVMVVTVALAIVTSLPFVSQATNTQPPPPPPPPVGVLGGPLAGLTTSQINFFTLGYGDFNIKWDPIRGLGPVFTDAACFTCHGGGNNVITQCQFNPPGVACVDGGSSNVLGTRYGKWNSDGTFNYLDGTGTFPENEGGPTLHNQSVSQFNTIPACDVMTVAASPTGATESGNTVTITTTEPHRFQVGQTAQLFKVGGLLTGSYNGIFTILTVPTAVTFTYTDTVSGLAASGAGSANNMPNESVPADATVVNKLRSTQLYGLGLVDSIPESTITANATAECSNQSVTGICGKTNMVPDQNGNSHVGRFGQKANIPNLLMFTAFAFNNELGITNAFFPVQHLPQGRAFPAACQPDTNNPEDVSGKDLLQAYQFNELLAPVAPLPPTSQTLAGQQVFETTGCNICHVESMTTGPNIKLALDLNGDLSGVIAPLSNATVNVYSDLLIHEMGSGLSGGIPFQPEQQGQADLTSWRTAPLWGLQTRCGTVASNGDCSLLLGLLHDNRTTNLNTAILDHGGEAANVITAYQALSPTDQANLFAFLSSL